MSAIRSTTAQPVAHCTLPIDRIQVPTYMEWEVEFRHPSEAEVLTLERDVRIAQIAAARLLADNGPQLSWPHADTLKGSRHANMKERRFEGGDGEWCAAFAFDPSERPSTLWRATNLASVRRASTRR